MGSRGDDAFRGAAPAAGAAASSGAAAASDATASGAAAAAAVRQPRQPPWSKMVPLAWAPVMYTLRFALQGRVRPATQHAAFAAMTIGALAHAGSVMFSDSSV